MTESLKPGFLIVATSAALAALLALAQDSAESSLARGMQANPTTLRARPGASCDELGEVFAANPLDDTLIVKGDRNDSMDTIRFSGTTQIVRLTAGPEVGGVFDPKNIQIGDRLCVELGDSPQKAVARILLMTRSDIQKQQKQVISVLRHNSAFGVISALKTESQIIQLDEALNDGTSRLVTVLAGNLVSFRHYSPDAKVGDDGIVTEWKHLRTGDQIYIEGQRNPESLTIRAGVIISGGVRGIFGIVVSINALDEVLDLEEPGSGNLTKVRIHPQDLFRVSPFKDSVSSDAGNTAAPWNLHPILFADLQKGDTVAVLGRLNEDPREVSGVIAVTGFGSFGLHPRAPGDPAFWVLDPLRRPR